MWQVAGIYNVFARGFIVLYRIVSHFLEFVAHVGVFPNISDPELERSPLKIHSYSPCDALLEGVSPPLQRETPRTHNPLWVVEVSAVGNTGVSENWISVERYTPMGSMMINLESWKYHGIPHFLTQQYSISRAQCSLSLSYVFHFTEFQ